MSSRSMTWRRIGVGAVAAATVAAGTPLLIGSASALEPQRLAITQDDGRSTAAAGTCTAFTVTATDLVGGPADEATVTVTIAESPNTGTHDVDFCVITGKTTPFTAVGQPRYTNSQTQPQIRGTNAGDPIAGTEQKYTAGQSITGGAGSNAGGNPDSSSNTSTVNFEQNPMEPNTPPDDKRNNSNNPSGTDSASFRTVGGKVRFGVVGLLPQHGATIDAYVDNNPAFTRDNNGNGTVTDTGDDRVAAPQQRIRFTDGGLPGTVAVANAARSVVASPDSTLEPKPSASQAARHRYTAQAFNGDGDVLGGLSTLRLTPVSGPNAATSTTAATGTGDCGPTGNDGGAATCTYDAQKAGTDTVAIFVNQSTGSPTFGLDATEPRDTATAETTPPAVASSEARRLVLTPGTASVTAGGGVDFTATVQDVNGAPAQHVSVTFFESGPGSLASPTSSSGVTSTRVVTTNGVGQAFARFTTTTGDTGTTTVFASITTPASTKCQQPASGSTPAGECSDSSPVTISSSASPSASPTATTSPSPSPSASSTTTPTPTATSTTPATADGSRYRGLGSPVRVLDTRDSGGRPRTGEIVLDLSGRITDPNATSAVLNVTVTNASRRGFLVAYPTGTPKPGTSNVNFERGQTQANEVVVRLGSNRRVSLFVDSASAHVIADLVGSFTTSTGTGVGEVVTNAPRRAFDSRTTGSPTRTGEVTVDLSGFLPAGATDAILNVTVTRTSRRGFVTVYPTGTDRPGTSNVNFEAGQTQANEVITRVGTGGNAGTVSFFIDSASSALVVDVVGAVTPGTQAQAFTALSSPQRALDTRDSGGFRRSGNIDLTLPSSVPANATGVILNVTATNGTRPGFVTVFPFGQTNPGTSNVNFPTSLTQANEVTTGLGDGNRVTLFVGGGGNPAAHVIVDVVGYLS